MAEAKKRREALAFKSPRRARVMAELKKLSDEWEEWEEHCLQIEDHPYDRNTESEVFADGVENMERHEILREKTLTFLDTNIQGHNFMCSNEYEKPFERNDLRLRVIVPHRTRDLKVLMASLEHALGFWRTRWDAWVKAFDYLPRMVLELPGKIAEAWVKKIKES